MEAVTPYQEALGFQARALVRRFSNQLNGQTSLDTALQSDAKRNELTELFEDALEVGSAEKNLDIFAPSYAAFLGLIKKVPEKQRWFSKKRASSPDRASKLFLESKIANPDDLKNLLNETESQWSSQHDQVLSYYR
ncbi:hypothetical protein VTN77DRAFT_4064 [Rasamsonia byssochlamydoides]|uniref:uncharacterized protein n=1 Tax=Rasamsonia byssochlamydoides TaxID=89139 RepID=UPI003742E1C8